MTKQHRALYARALLVWPVFLVAAITLGAIREGFILPLVGEQKAHISGTLVFVCVMLMIQWGFVAITRERIQPQSQWLIGLMWTLMTISFEFGFFHFVMGVPWRMLLADYDLFAGRLWLLVLLTTLCGLRLIDIVRHREMRGRNRP